MQKAGLILRPLVLRTICSFLLDLFFYFLRAFAVELLLIRLEFFYKPQEFPA